MYFDSLHKGCRIWGALGAQLPGNLRGKRALPGNIRGKALLKGNLRNQEREKKKNP
jgi:hypothetical protein